MDEPTFIKNKNELVTTSLRADALAILEAGLQAVRTDNVITSQVSRTGNTLTVPGGTIDLDAYERIFFVGIGKCAADAAVVFDEMIGDMLTDGIIIDVRGVPLKKIRSKIGTHPFPSEQNVEAAQEVRRVLDEATDRDLVIAVISGGGSALLCLPHDVNCEILTKITGALMDQGATIGEINTVRKHTSEIQGGQFAKLTHPARLVTFIFSDVPGNDLDVIASGPTVMDTTTKEDAERVLAKYQVRDVCAYPDCEVLETPKDPAYFERVENILLATNERALGAMQEEAEQLGYHAQIVDTKVEGEARVVGAHMAREAGAPGACLLYGGETTVTVTTPGKGGRCQEVALGGLPFINTHSILVAAASDGWDNTDMAGAIADDGIAQRAIALSLDHERFLEENRSYEFFERVSGHIKTGRTGMNVSDLYFTLTNKPQ